MKTPRLLALPMLLCALLAAPGAPSLAQPGSTSAASTLPRIAFEKYELPNGLDVILVEDKKLPVVAVNVWYHVGPANEAPAPEARRATLAQFRKNQIPARAGRMFRCSSPTYLADCSSAW